MRLTALLAIALLAIVLTLSWLWPDAPPPPALPQGPQTIEGTLERAPLSQARRGTHLITQAGKRLFFAESSTLNLQSYVGRSALLTGTFEPNLSPDLLPVFVVTSIEAETDDLRSEDLAPLPVQLNVPASWVRQTSTGAVTFTLDTAGKTRTILSIEDAIGTLDGLPNSTVAGQPARRTTTASGHTVLVVERGQGRRLRFTYSPASSTGANLGADTTWTQILQSLRLEVSKTPSGQITGSGAGLACGGPAGLLCAPGLVCRITDAALAIGTCALPR